MKMLCLMRKRRNSLTPGFQTSEYLWARDSLVGRASLEKILRLNLIRDGEGSHWIEERFVGDPQPV